MAGHLSLSRRAVVVERLTDGWRVRLDGKEAQAKTLVEALESVRNHRAGDAELDVVLAALIRDRKHAG